jgi:hypothetical protein
MQCLIVIVAVRIEGEEAESLLARSGGVLDHLTISPATEMGP